MEISSEGAQEAHFTPEECLLLLATQQFGRLVFGESEPQIRPMNYIIDDGDIVLRVDHPMPLPEHVVFEVDQVDQLERQGWSVIVNGRASTHLVDECDPVIREQLAPWAPGPMMYVIRIFIDRVSGRWVRAGRTHRTFEDRGYM